MHLDLAARPKIYYDYSGRSVALYPRRLILDKGLAKWIPEPKVDPDPRLFERYVESRHERCTLHANGLIASLRFQASCELESIANCWSSRANGTWFMRNIAVHSGATAFRLLNMQMKILVLLGVVVVVQAQGIGTYGLNSNNPFLFLLPEGMSL